MHEAAAALVLFRLGDRAYACPREKVRQVVDVGAGQPPVPGMEPSSLSALQGLQRPLRLVSLRLALGLPDHGPEGRILVVTTRNGPVGFLVDEVLRVVEVDAAAVRAHHSRLGGGYVIDTVEAVGITWMLVDFDGLRLPGRLGALRDRASQGGC